MSATSGENGSVRLFGAPDASDGPALEGHAARANSVAFAPDGKHVLTASSDATAVLWDVDGGVRAGDREGGRQGLGRRVA